MSIETKEFGFWENVIGYNLEESRFGIISVVLLIVGCLGGLTVGYGAIHHTWQLIAIVIPTMTTLSLLLAVAPVKYILNMGVITLAINILIMIINFIG